MSGDSSLGIGIGLALKSYGRGLTYVKTDRALDLGNLAPFTIPDLSGNANTATLNTGIYVSTNGTTDKAIGAGATALGSGNYYLSGKIKPAGTTAKTTMDGSTASNLTGLTAGVWQDFQTATASAITPSSINLGWDGTAFNATVDSWSDVKLHDASDDSVVAHWKLYDSADASLDGYPALDCVGGYHGAHVGCAGGSGEGDILQTAGEDFNNLMWFDGVNNRVLLPSQIIDPFSAWSISFSILSNNPQVQPFIYCEASTVSGTPFWGIHGGQSAVGQDSSKIAIQLRNDAGTIFRAIGDSVIFDGDQHDITVTYDGVDSVVFEVDGVAESAKTWEPTGSCSVNTATWGARSDASPDLFLDGVLLFDTSLSQSGSLVSSYVGNGNTDAAWVDQIGSNDGTVYGSPSLYHVAESETTAGQDALGTAIENPRPNERVLNLTTGTGYAEIADSASLDLTTEATWELWGNFYGLANEYYLSKYTTATANRAWAIGRETNVLPQADNEIRIILSGNGTSLATVEWSGIPDSVGQLVITYNAGTLRAYFNGSDLGAGTVLLGTVPASIHVNAEPVTIGAFFTTTQIYKTTKQLGDIRIYDSVLTAAEVLKNYQARKSAYGL